MSWSDTRSQSDVTAIELLQWNAPSTLRRPPSVSSLQIGVCNDNLLDATDAHVVERAQRKRRCGTKLRHWRPSA